MKRILIVDDDDMNCLMAEHALRGNHEVFAVNSGKEALAFLEEQPVDLILMDIAMPEMNGKETACRIRENPEWEDIPLVFLTADSDPRTEVEYLNWGADDFITKPFNPVVMNTRISRILEVYALRKDLEKKLESRTKQMKKATMKSMTDPLTGLGNRDYLEKNLSKLLRNPGEGTMFMIDIDNFKLVNDTYGHIVGDKTLQHFAQVLKSYSRDGDLVCRLAGDEFVTYYPELIDRNVAAEKATGIIQSFAKKMTTLGYGGIASVSIGIVMVQEDEDFQSLYNKADKSLYFVKNNGKNAYHFYGEHNAKLKEVNTVADLEYVSQMMEKGMSERKGVFQLAYDEFMNVYEFISRYVDRNNQKVQIVLFTMHMAGKDANIPLEEIMDEWEALLVPMLRAVDTGTRYSSSQYMLILMDADVENGKAVAQRVIDKFYESNEKLRSEVKVTYDLRTLEPKE